MNRGQGLALTIIQPGKTPLQHLPGVQRLQARGQRLQPVRRPPGLLRQGALQPSLQMLQPLLSVRCRPGQQLGQAVGQ